jgi:metal transporter CNNM
MDYLITILLLACSALFSGLTLGLMGLRAHSLQRKARLGSVQAAALYPIRARGNFLLATLLLGNTAVNATLSVYLGSIAPGVIAGIVATGLILIFGEIIPQAAFSRHALVLGARMVPIVRGLMFVSWPIAYPISWVLDRTIGRELPTIYSKREIMEIVSEHEDSAQSTIDHDEERIVHGALQFSQKRVVDVMTPRDQVSTLSASAVLDASTRAMILEEGYSRFPVLSGSPTRVVGILYTKDIVVEPHDETVKDVCERRVLRTRPTETLDNVLAHMLTKRQHIAIVHDEKNGFLGVITLEDILEEVIQREIFDEEDDDETQVAAEPVAHVKDA